MGILISAVVWYNAFYRVHLVLGGDLLEIDINQINISIGDKYQIYIDGRQTFKATTKLFRLFDEIHLYDHLGDKLIYKIKKKWSFKVAYDLTAQSNDVFHFQTKQYLRGHFYCEAGDDFYEVFAHKDRKYSIYKNDIQVAWWDKKAVAWFDGDNYKIIADNDSAYELIISFCLIIDNAFSKSNNKTTVTLDLGNLLQAREFDPTWRPK